MNQRQAAHGPRISPWFIAAAVLGVAVMVGVMFHRDYRREQGYLRDTLLQRGEVLIHSVEMVGRVGFSESGAEEQLLNFWNNLEDDDGVLFIAVTDAQGQPEALAGSLTPSEKIFSAPQPTPYAQGPIAPSYRAATVDGRPVSLVYRSFWPRPRPRGMVRSGPRHMMPRQHHERGEMRELQGRPERYLWIGFDLTAFEAGSRERVRTAAVSIGLLGLAALAGVLALIWGHNSRLVRRLYQDTNALAAELIGRLPVGVILKDREGTVSLVNRSTLTISGLAESDFLGQRLESLTQGRFPTEETMSGRETRLSFGGGPPVLVALTSGPVVGEDGHPLGQVILMEDLGELGRLKAELSKKERLAALGGLAAGLAHEIRNPLGAIRGLSQHLLNKGPADPNDREALEVVLASVDRLNAAITDFLNYARPTDLKTAPLDVAELIRKMAALAGHDAQSRAVALALDLPEEPLMIDGDEALLSQAFLNLYLNAIQAAGERAGGGGRLCVTLKAAGERAVVTFSDNGPGFSPEQLAQPFVPYFTTKAEGTGLGLAMVEKAVRAHSGADITLASPPSGGGLVTVTLALRESDHESSAQDAPETADIDS